MDAVKLILICLILLLGHKVSADTASAHHIDGRNNSAEEATTKQPDIVLSNTSRQGLNISGEITGLLKNNSQLGWDIVKLDKPMEGSKEVLETQQTTCQVTTEELVATAQATVTRVMKGLCNAKEMSKQFSSLEEQLEKYFSSLKDTINALEDKIADQSELNFKFQKQITKTISKACEERAKSEHHSEVNTRISKLIHPETLTHGPWQSFDPIHEEFVEETEGETSIRDPEVVLYNSSIHLEPSLNGHSEKVFTYYWKVRNMSYKIAGWSPRRSERSPSFYIFPGGYRMYMRVIPRHMNENFYIHVGVTKGDFDDTLSWPFPLKHRVHIMDQTKEGRSFEDIASRLWDPTHLCSEFNWQKPTKGDNYECVGLGFPHDVLKQRDYISKDILIIKLTVYLQ